MHFSLIACDIDISVARGSDRTEKLVLVRAFIYFKDLDLEGRSTSMHMELSSSGVLTDCRKGGGGGKYADKLYKANDFKQLCFNKNCRHRSLNWV